MTEGNVADYLPLSGLQHLVFCERQAALIHVERVWLDNVLTVTGEHHHAAVHERAPRRERRGNLIIARGLELRSERLGVVGVADVVEFHRVERAGPTATRLPGACGWWRPVPVEYKRGRPKPHRADEVQLCAQAMCIEEMLGVSVLEGALSYGKTHRRLAVSFDASLRALCVDASRRFHEIVASGITPPPVRTPACGACSLEPVCEPRLAAERRSVARYVQAAVRRALARDDGEPPR